MSLGASWVEEVLIGAYLNPEAAAEADQKSFCDEEISESRRQPRKRMTAPLRVATAGTCMA